jgi:heptose-I-phosphate ethanolaminephosphotransferase
VNKKLTMFVFRVIAIFFSWILVGFLGGGDYFWPRYIDFIFPFLWLGIFIYLCEKNYIYIVIASYFIFLAMLLVDKLNFGHVVVEIQMSYLLISISVALIYIFINQNTNSNRLTAISCFLISFSLCLMPLFYVIYIVSFGAIVSREVVYSIVQTNLIESFEFVGDFISPLWLGVVFFIILFLGFMFYRQERVKVCRVDRLLLLFASVIIIPFSYFNKEHLRIYSFIGDSADEYWKEISLFKETQEKVNTNKVIFNSDKAGLGETYVVVVGESLNKKHMGMYGYLRDTTPSLDRLLERGVLLRFDNIYSSHTHTMQVLSLSLTEASQLNEKSYYDSLSIINVLNKADIATFWATNQVLYGPWDNLVSVIAHQADNLVSLNNSVGKRTATQVYDGSLIDEVKSILSKKSKKNRVIFVHLMGSHRKYCLRFPVEYDVFSGRLEASEFGALADIEKIYSHINCYDNSVLYNDYVISSLISALDGDGGIGGLLYFSDHADDIENGLGHNSANFTYAMLQTPLIMWFSEEYRLEYKGKVDALMGHRKVLFSNDYIYDTLLGVFNIQSDRYQAVNDLSSSKYSLEEKEALTLHGEIPYAGELNYHFIQNKNISILTGRKEELRVIPHRVNSLGKLTDVWFDGYRAFEIDLIYGYDGKDTFVVGHNDGAMGDMSFEEFIATVAYSEVDKIWLDIKNITQENSNRVLARLNYLDRRFSLKKKLIVESDTKHDSFVEFKKSGWHSSYYLPTKKILGYMKESKIQKLEGLANSLAAQSIRQELSAISFDYRLYPFVKGYLEPLLVEDIKYHMWDLTTKLYSHDFHEKLNSNIYYSDDRVETVLVPYRSPFSL